MNQILVVCVMAAAVCCVGAQYGHEKAEDHYDAHPQYKFEYKVHDAHTGDIKSQREERDGDVVHGSYELVEPDGSKRVVEYSADKKSGFHAVVHREENAHPAPQEYKPKYEYKAKPEVPKVENKYEAPKYEYKFEEPAVEEPKFEEFKFEEPKFDEFKFEEPKFEEYKFEEPKFEELKFEESKFDFKPKLQYKPKFEESKYEEFKFEEPKFERKPRVEFKPKFEAGKFEYKPVYETQKYDFKPKMEAPKNEPKPFTKIAYSSSNLKKAPPPSHFYYKAAKVEAPKKEAMKSADSTKVSHSSISTPHFNIKY